MKSNLSGKTVLVTGATSGIGLAVAEQLARKGAHVLGVGRDTGRCRAATYRLRQANPDAQTVFFTADLRLQGEVRKLAQDVKDYLDNGKPAGLDGLVNNAGTFTFWQTLTQEGFETQWAVNHLAPFLLTHALMPLLQVSPDSRVITVSSGSHYGTKLNWEDIQLRKNYNGLRAYRQTKLANVLFTAQLNRINGKNGGLRAMAADPGLVQTDIGLKGTPPFVRWIWKLRRAGGKDPLKPAQGIVEMLEMDFEQYPEEIYWKYGKPKAPDPYALDPEYGARLWEQSERMCGINWS